MNITLKQIAAVLTALFALLGAAWGLQKQFTPREVTELLVADLQRNQMMIQKNIQIQQAQQWLFYWQYQVNQLTGVCAREPYNSGAKAALQQATRERDRWHMEVQRLMQP